MKHSCLVPECVKTSTANINPRPLCKNEELAGLHYISFDKLLLQITTAPHPQYPIKIIIGKNQTSSHNDATTETGVL